MKPRTSSFKLVDIDNGKAVDQVKFPKNQMGFLTGSDLMKLKFSRKELDSMKLIWIKGDIAEWLKKRM
jgi:hypothetical protein